MTTMTGSCRPATGRGIRVAAVAGSGAAAHGTAFTIVEAVISTIIVAVMLVAALSTVGASRLAQQRTSRFDRGRLLAEALMAEIRRQPYEDPEGSVVFGLEAGETGTTREDFDDVDDYHNWSESPPTYKDGSAVPQAEGWTRTVTVQWVNSLDPSQPRTMESGAKRIKVTVSHNTVPQATLVAIRTMGR